MNYLKNLSRDVLDVGMSPVLENKKGMAWLCREGAAEKEGGRGLEILQTKGRREIINGRSGSSYHRRKRAIRQMLAPCDSMEKEG